MNLTVMIERDFNCAHADAMHRLSAVRECLFNIFAVTFHLEVFSYIRNVRTLYGMGKNRIRIFRKSCMSTDVTKIKIF
jgi:hypothetical protein